MNRDSFDMFKPPERGRFGDNENARQQNETSLISYSEGHEFTLYLRREEMDSIAVQEQRGFSPWIWLPKSKIQFTKKDKGMVDVSMPEWLARDRGLL